MVYPIVVSGVAGLRLCESPRARAARAGVTLPGTFDAWFFGCVERDPNARFRRASDAITALGAVFVAAVYRYAATGTAPSAFDAGLVETAFRPRD